MLQRIFSLFLCLFLVAACQQTPPARLGKPQFSGPAFQFNAAVIEIEKSAAPKADDAQDRNQFPTRLDAGMEQWARDRLAMRGGDARLKLDIEEASVTEEQLPVTRGFMGLFKNEQSSRYTARLKASLAIYTADRPTARAGASSEANRMITVAEGASVAERQQAYNDLVISVLQAIDAELSRQIPQNFGPYLAGY